MFGLQTREKTINEVLSVIDKKINYYQAELSDIYMKLYGHAKAQDKWDVSGDLRMIQLIHDKIDCLVGIRLNIEYM